MTADALNKQLKGLAFYASRPTPCSYLPGRETVNLFTDPAAPMNTAIYSRLADFGFRRSGAHVYRPRCPACQACVPVRVPVATFHPNRSQRRCQQRNADLSIHARPAGYDDEAFALYRRYIASRHAGGGMDDPQAEQYLAFLTSPWAETLFVEYRWQDTLLAVSVLDVLQQGLSAVYTFFDPAQSARSLGRLAVLWAIEECRRRGLGWLYLGYWIADCRKMQYKQEYRPLELLRGGHWQAFARGALLPGEDTSSA